MPILSQQNLFAWFDLLDYLQFPSPIHGIPLIDIACSRVNSSNISPEVLDENLFTKNLTFLTNKISNKSIKEKVAICVTTPEQIEKSSSVAEYFFIPGELSRQTDVLTAASKTNKIIILEKGPFLGPKEFLLSIDKLNSQNIILIESGYSFGYSDRIIDIRSLAILSNTKKEFGINLSELNNNPDSSWEHKPLWLIEDDYTPQIIKAAKCLGAKYFIYNPKNISNLSMQLLTE